MPLEGLPCPTPRTTTASRPSTPCACSSRRRGASSPASSPRAEAPPSSTSAARSKACRWRWSWPRRGRACCPATAIAAELRQGTELLRARDASQPRAPRQHRGWCSSNRGGGWRRPSAMRWRGCRCSAAASRSTPRAPSPARRCRCSARSADKSLLRKDAGGERHVAAPAGPAAGGSAARRPPAAAATAAVHAAYFHRWLQAASAGAADGDRDALQAIDAEFENCRQAWSQAIAQGDAAGVGRERLNPARLGGEPRPLRR